MTSKVGNPTYRTIFHRISFPFMAFTPRHHLQKTVSTTAVLHQTHKKCVPCRILPSYIPAAHNRYALCKETVQARPAKEPRPTPSSTTLLPPVSEVGKGETGTKSEETLAYTPNHHTNLIELHILCFPFNSHSNPTRRIANPVSKKIRSHASGEKASISFLSAPSPWGGKNRAAYIRLVCFRKYLRRPHDFCLPLVPYKRGFNIKS